MRVMASVPSFRRQFKCLSWIDIRMYSGEMAYTGIHPSGSDPLLNSANFMEWTITNSWNSKYKMNCSSAYSSFTLHPVLASLLRIFFWGTDLKIHFSPTMKSGSIMENDRPSYSKSESDLCAVIICSCDSKYCSVRLKATESSFVDWLQILHYCCEYILAAWSTNMGVSWYAWCLHLWHPTNIWSILHSPMLTIWKWIQSEQLVN